MSESAAMDSRMIGNSRKSLVWQTLLVIGLLTVVYLPILQAMVNHWQVVPDYSHGFLIAPLALYFAYEKKYYLTAAPVESNWWGLAFMAIGLLTLAAGQLGGLLTPLRASYIITLMGIVLFFLGREVFKLLLFPMAFLFLMVPLPQSVVNLIAFPLQLVAAQWAVDALQMLKIPVLLEGNIIHMAHSDLFVAEACSGLRSLMALLTLGIVFAHFFRPGKPIQQIFLVASTIPIAVVINSLRVALTGLLAHHFGQQAATGFIHEFQGMITFTVAFLVLLTEGSLLGIVVDKFRRFRTG
ncbi:MAG: exosortase [Deltaproteobacteria bacterium]|nr:exosortase [Deltaproteobacteria bacterium]